MSFLRIQRTSFTDCCDDGADAVVAPVDNSPLSVIASIDAAAPYGLNIVATLNHVWPYDVTVTGRFKYKPNPIPEVLGDWSVVIPAGSLSALSYQQAGTWNHFDSYSVCISNAVDSKGVHPIYLGTVCDVSFDTPVSSGSVWAFINRHNARVYKGANFADFTMQMYKGDTSGNHPDAATAPLYKYTGSVPYSVRQTGTYNADNNSLNANFNNADTVDINLQPVSKDGNLESNPSDNTYLAWKFRDLEPGVLWKFIKNL